MTDIVPFKPKQKEVLVWVCGCGCGSFTLSPDGTAECAICHEKADWKAGAWFVGAVEAARTDKPPINSHGSFNDSGDFAARIAKRRADVADFIVSGTYQGSVSAWSAEFFETPVQRDWIKRQLEIGLKLLLEEGVS